MTATAMPIRFPVVVTHVSDRKWLMDKGVLWFADARLALLANLANHLTHDGLWAPGSRLQYKGRKPFRMMAELPDSTPDDAQAIYTVAEQRRRDGTTCSVLGNRDGLAITDPFETLGTGIGTVDIMPWEVVNTETGESLGAIEGRFFMGLVSVEQAHFRWGLVAHDVEGLFAYWNETGEPCAIIPELRKIEPDTE